MQVGRLCTPFGSFLRSLSLGARHMEVSPASKGQGFRRPAGRAHVGARQSKVPTKKMPANEPAETRVNRGFFPVKATIRRKYSEELRFLFRISRAADIWILFIQIMWNSNLDFSPKDDNLG